MKKSPILIKIQKESKKPVEDFPKDRIEQLQSRFQSALKGYFNKAKIEEPKVKQRKYFGGLYY